VLRVCIALKKSMAGFEPATFGSSGKHTNHYISKATYHSVNKLVFSRHFFRKILSVNTRRDIQLGDHELATARNA
jgi:hypothetical protein